MPTADRQLTNSDRVVLTQALDRMVPPVDEFPGAGGLDLIGRLERLAARQDRLRSALVSVLDALSLDVTARAEGGFAALGEDRQIEALKLVEQGIPDQFASFVELVYDVYYTDDRVYERIGWAGRPPQPEGFEMEPWDPAVLEKARAREPFWRPVEQQVETNAESQPPE